MPKFETLGHIVTGWYSIAIFAALFYLQLNPSKVKVRMNLLVAWFIYIGAVALSLLLAIEGKFATWIQAIQVTALAVSIFFMLISMDPSAKPNVSMPASNPPSTPPTTPPQ